MAKIKTKLNKKQNKRELSIIPTERVVSKIFLIRGKKVMFDKDLAELYGVETKSLNRAVKRNLDRFPTDFMFQLNKNETEIWKSQIETFNTSNLRSQFVTLSSNLKYQNGTSSWGGRRYLPMVFTEQGVAMLSSVLNSKRAVQVNIQIIRTFTELREFLMTNKELRIKIENIEKKYDSKLKKIFDMLKQLFMEKAKPKNQIGFRKN